MGGSSFVATVHLWPAKAFSPSASSTIGHLDIRTTCCTNSCVSRTVSPVPGPMPTPSFQPATRRIVRCGSLPRIQSHPNVAVNGSVIYSACAAATIDCTGSGVATRHQPCAAAQRGFARHHCRADFPHRSRHQQHMAIRTFVCIRRSQQRQPANSSGPAQRSAPCQSPQPVLLGIQSRARSTVHNRPHPRRNQLPDLWRGKRHRQMRSQYSAARRLAIRWQSRRRIHGHNPGGPRRGSIAREPIHILNCLRNQAAARRLEFPYPATHPQSHPLPLSPATPSPTPPPRHDVKTRHLFPASAHKFFAASPRNSSGLASRYTSTCSASSFR